MKKLVLKLILSVLLLFALILLSSCTNIDLAMKNGESSIDIEEAHEETLDAENKQVEELFFDNIEDEVINEIELEPTASPEIVETEKDFEKVAYLTFDDGPSYVTEDVLEILEEYDVKATFFVVYCNYAERTGLYKRIVDEGHSIGNHTYTHTQAIFNWDNFFEDMYKMEDFIFEQTGVRTKLLRFPGGTDQRWYESIVSYGKVTELLDMGYQYYDWNVSTSDGGSNEITVQHMVSKVKSGSQGKDIINVLMHDRHGKDLLVEALPQIIEYLRDEGYEFLPITEDSFAPHIYEPTESKFYE